MLTPVKRAAQRVPHGILPVPLTCPHADILHHPGSHACSRRVRQVEKGSELTTYPVYSFPLMIRNTRDQAADTSRANVAAGDQAKEIERLKKDLGKHLSLVVGYILMISIHFQTR